MEERTCGNCIHFHLYESVPKGKNRKDGYCGLGKHDKTDVPECRVYDTERKEKPTRNERRRMREEKAVLDRLEADKITGTRGRFTSNPWKNYLK